MTDEYFRTELPQNSEAKTFYLRWHRVGKGKILQQLVEKKYSDHYEDEWREIKIEDKQDD